MLFRSKTIVKKAPVKAVKKSSKKDSSDESDSKESDEEKSDSEDSEESDEVTEKKVEISKKKSKEIKPIEKKKIYKKLNEKELHNEFVKTNKIMPGTLIMFWDWIMYDLEYPLPEKYGTRDKLWENLAIMFLNDERQNINELYDSFMLYNYNNIKSGNVERYTGKTQFGEINIKNIRLKKILSDYINYEYDESHLGIKHTEQWLTNA